MKPKAVSSVFAWSCEPSANSINRAIWSKKREEIKNIKNFITPEKDTEENRADNCDFNHFKMIDQCANNDLLNVDVEEVTKQSLFICIQCDLLTDKDNSAPQIVKRDAETNTKHIVSNHE